MSCEKKEKNLVVKRFVRLLAPELDANKLMMAEVGEKNLIELIQEFKAIRLRKCFADNKRRCAGRTNEEVSSVCKQVTETRGYA